MFSVNVPMIQVSELEVNQYYLFSYLGGDLIVFVVKKQDNRFEGKVLWTSTIYFPAGGELVFSNSFKGRSSFLLSQMTPQNKLKSNKYYLLIYSYGFPRENRELIINISPNQTHTKI